MRTKKLFATLSVAMLIGSGRLHAEDVSTTLSRADIEKIVREYILQHPEVLMESVRANQARERVEAQNRSKDAVAANRRELFDDAGSPAAGTGAAEVTIVQFFDYKCGYCRRVSPVVSKLLDTHKNVRMIFKEFPILGQESQVAARAALAAAKQGAYVPFHEELLNWNGPITPASVEDIGRKLGMDVAQLKADMSSKDVDAELIQNRQLANAIGVQSTPSFVIGGELISGAMDLTGFEEVISKKANR